MIKRIRISNFQSHRDTELELTEGFNVFAGATNQGKSAIFRAVNWCINNNLRGTGYRPASYPVGRSDMSSCIVEFSNHSQVSRVRSEIDNNYTIVDDIEDGLSNIRTFTALGSNGVPDEVKAITKMDEINFNGQEDGRFLLGRGTSAGEVARLLNQYVGLQIIDTVMDKAKGNVNRLNTELESARADLTAKEAELQALDYIPRAEEAFTELDALIERENQLLSSVEAVTSLTQRAQLNRNRIADNQSWLEVVPLLGQLVELVTASESVNTDIKHVELLSSRVRSLKQNIGNKHQRLQDLQTSLNSALNQLQMCPVFNVECCLPHSERA